MFTRNRPGAVEQPVSPQDSKDFKNSLQQLRAMLIDSGFARDAVEALRLDLKSYRLPKDEDAGSIDNALGKSVFAVTVAAPGRMAEFRAPPNGEPYASQSSQMQASLLAFEIGFNVFNLMEGNINQWRFLNAKPNAGQPFIAGGCFASTDRMEIETTFHGLSVSEYMEALNYGLKVTLMRAGQKVALSAPKGPSP